MKRIAGWMAIVMAATILGLFSVGCGSDSTTPEVAGDSLDATTHIGTDVIAVEPQGELAQACLTDDSEFAEGSCYYGCGILNGYCVLEATSNPAVATCVATDPFGADIVLTTAADARKQEAAAHRKLNPCDVPTCTEEGSLTVQKECGTNTGWVVLGSCFCERAMAELPIGGEISEAILDASYSDLLVFLIREGDTADVIRHFLGCLSQDLSNCLQILPEKFFSGDSKARIEAEPIPTKDTSKSVHYLAAWVNTPAGAGPDESSAVMTAVEVPAAPASSPAPEGSPSKITLGIDDVHVVGVIPAPLSIDRALLAVETAGNGDTAPSGVTALLVALDLTSPQWYQVLDSMGIGEGLRLEDVVGIGVFEVVLMVEEALADGIPQGWGPLHAELLSSEADQLQELSEKTSLGLDCQVGTAHALYSSQQNALFVVCTDPNGYLAARRLRINFELGDFVPEILAPAKTYGSGVVAGLTMAQNSGESVLVASFETTTSDGVSEVRLTAFSSDLQLRVSDSPFLPINPWGHFSPDVRAAVTDDGQRLVITYIVRGRKGPVEMGSLVRLFRGVTSLELH